MKPLRWTTLLLATLLLPAPFWDLHTLQAEEGSALELNNQVVCRINTEAVSKRDVEDRMTEIMSKLWNWRKMLEESNQWDAEAEKKWDSIYGPAFADSLRNVVRERVMLQCAADESLKIDEKSFNKRWQESFKKLRGQGRKEYTPNEVQKVVRESMLIDAFRTRFWAFDPVTRPMVEQYYKDNIDHYQRQEGAKVRLIRIDRFVTNKLTKKQTMREDALALAEELHKDVTVYGAVFAEVAKAHSDDLASAQRGGLLQMDPKDPYIDPNSFPQLADAIRGLKAGEVSKVFEFGQNSWAFALVEDRRAVGPAPLDSDLYEKLLKNMTEVKTRKKEDEWFHQALGKRLISRIVDGVEKPVPLEFFFVESEQSSSEN